jgi:hypothetical protein
MDTLDRLSGYINRAAWDKRLRPTHISLYFALCHSWIVNKFQRCYHVSRRQLMMLSGIRSPTTYHKAMCHLKDLGYVKYRPSYHPVEGSEVSLLGVTPFSVNDRDLNQDSPSFHRTLDEEVRNLDQNSNDHKQGEKNAIGTNR